MDKLRLLVSEVRRCLRFGRNVNCGKTAEYSSIIIPYLSELLSYITVYIMFNKYRGIENILIKVFICSKLHDDLLCVLILIIGKLIYKIFAAAI